MTLTFCARPDARKKRALCRCCGLICDLLRSSDQILNCLIHIFFKKAMYHRRPSPKYENVFLTFMHLASGNI